MSTQGILRTYLYYFFLPRHPGCFSKTVSTVKQNPKILKHFLHKIRVHRCFLHGQGD